MKTVRLGKIVSFDEKSGKGVIEFSNRGVIDWFPDEIPFCIKDIQLNGEDDEIYVGRLADV